MTVMNGRVHNLSLLQRERLQTRSSLNYNHNFKNKRPHFINIGRDYCLDGLILVNLIKRV